MCETVEKFVPKKREYSNDYFKINQLLKQINDFEDVFSEIKNLELIIQLQNSIISENPLMDDSLEDDEIVVSTAQKIIDYS